MRRSVFLFAALTAATFATAEEPKPDVSEDLRERPHGILSHGDSGDIMEDFFGGRVQRTPEDEPVTARDKHDPAVKWDGPRGIR